LEDDNIIIIILIEVDKEFYNNDNSLEDKDIIREALRRADFKERLNKIIKKAKKSFKKPT